MPSVRPRPLETEHVLTAFFYRKDEVVILCLKVQSFLLKIRKILSYTLKTECISS